MDSNFNNPNLPGAPAPAATEPAATEPTAAADAKALSPAAERFQSCRWRKAAENSNPEHCTHRDVLPMAGTTGFVPDSWCSDCGYFKAKRSPRKRPEPERDTWNRW